MKSLKKIATWTLIISFCLVPTQVDQTWATDQRYIDEQVKTLKSTNPLGRQKAILNLMEIGAPQAIDIIMKALGDPDPYVRYTAAWALNPLNMKFTIIFEEQAIKRVFSRLTPLKSKKIVSALLGALPNDDFWVNREILVALREFFVYQQSQGVPLDIRGKQAALVHFENADPDIRAVAAQIMNLWRKVPLIGTMFRKAFREDILPIRLSALTYFEQDIDLLEEALRDPSFFVRNKAIKILRKHHLHDPRTLDLLVQQLGDPFPEIMYNAIEGLGWTKSSKAVKPLLEFEATHNIYDVHYMMSEAIKAITGRPIDEIRKEYNLDLENSWAKNPFIKKQNTSDLIRKIKSGRSAEVIFALHELEWKMDNSIIFFLEGIKNDDARLRFAFTSFFPTYIVQHSIPPDEFELVLDGLEETTKTPNPHIRKAAIASAEAFLIKFKHKTTREQYKRPIIALLTNVYQKEKDPIIVKHRIRHYSHIWGTDPETITLSPEFK